MLKGAVLLFDFQAFRFDFNFESFSLFSACQSKTTSFTPYWKVRNFYIQNPPLPKQSSILLMTRSSFLSLSFKPLSVINHLSILYFLLHFNCTVYQSNVSNSQSHHTSLFLYPDSLFQVIPVKFLLYQSRIQSRVALKGFPLVPDWLQFELNKLIEIFLPELFCVIETNLSDQDIMESTPLPLEIRKERNESWFGFIDQIQLKNFSLPLTSLLKENRQDFTLQFLKWLYVEDLLRGSQYAQIIIESLIPIFLNSNG